MAIFAKGHLNGEKTEAQPVFLDVTPELADFYHDILIVKLTDAGATQEDIGLMVGKCRQTVSARYDAIDEATRRKYSRLDLANILGQRHAS